MKLVDTFGPKLRVKDDGDEHGITPRWGPVAAHDRQPAAGCLAAKPISRPLQLSLHFAGA